jgi:predicted PurR-regulated permease PerM
MKTLSECNKIFSGFIIGKSIDSLIIGILCFILMTLFKMPYALIISAIVGVTNMIPYFGPFIGAVPGTIILLLMSPLRAFGFIILIFVLQQFDGLYLGPKILGDSTGLKPLWIIFAITLGGNLAGVLGMFFGVPIIAVIAYLANNIIERKLKSKDITID